MQAVITSAWRRRLFVLGVEQLAFALAVVFAGAIVMLLLGTQLFAWHWLLLLGAIGLAIGFARIRSRIIRRYEVAQILDERLQLSDSLSTAWFLLSGQDRSENPAARFQIQQASELAATIHASSAFPLAGQRAWALTVAMAVVSFGLVGLRFFTNSTLDLRPALVRLPFSAFTAEGTKAQAVERKPAPLVPGDQAREVVPDLPRDPSAKSSQADRQGASGDQKSDQKSTDPSQGKSAQSGDKDREGATPSDSASNANKSDSQNPSQNSARPQQSGDPKNSEQQSASNGKPNEQQSSGLLDKMKDAISSLMAKMRPTSNPNSPQQGNKQSSPQQSSQNQKSASNDSSSQSQQSQKSQDAQQSQSASSSQATEKTKASASATSNDTAQTNGNDPQSGAGRQDGQKDIRQADQLKAMGKLAEIIGKRSASLTGEMSVEKPSGQQTLQTQYSNKVGRHVDSGGEVNRNEIPLEYQEYVREYMNQVHKQANAQ